MHLLAALYGSAGHSVKVGLPVLFCIQHMIYVSCYKHLSIMDAIKTQPIDICPT